MNRIVKIFFLACALFFMSGCEDAVIPPDVEFEVIGEQLEADASGGVYFIEYRLENAVEGETVGVSTEESWIGLSFDTSVSGMVTFNIEPNDSTVAREGYVRIWYTALDDEFTVKIIQDAAGSIIVEPKEIEVPAEGGVYSLSCRAAVAGTAFDIEASSEQDWLNGFKIEQNGTVSFNVDANKDGIQRTGAVDVSDAVSGDTISVVVSQDAYVSPFAFSFGEISFTHVRYSVSPEDKEMTYVTNVIEKEVFDGYGSDEAYFQNELEYFNMMATIYQLPLEEYLSGVLHAGDYKEGYSEILEPETEHYIYAYGMDLSGTRLTDIVKTEFTTESKPRVDMTFEFEYDLVEMRADVMVVPNTQDYYYYFSVMRTEGLDENTDMETIMQDYLDYVKEYYMMSEGGTVEDAMRMICYHGIGLNSFDLQQDKEYVLFAAGVDLVTGMVISEVATEIFHSGSVGPSENEIVLELVNEGFTTADVMIHTTNDDPYVFFIDVAANTEGMTDDEILEYYNAKDLSYFQREGDFLAEITDREPGTEYRAFAFGYSNYVVTTELTWLTFKAHELGESDIELEIDFDEYFSLAQLKDAYPDEFSDIPSAYEAVMPVSVNVVNGDSDGAAYHYMLYKGDYTDVANPYDLAEDVMLQGCPYPSTEFYFTEGCWGVPYTIVGVVADKDGNYGKLATRLVTLSQDGISPVEEYVFPQ